MVVAGSVGRRNGSPERTPRRQPAREPAARTYAPALPLVPVRARGLTIEGADGRRYLDCTSGAGTLALGHNHPVVLAAIRKVLDSGAPLQAPDLATPVKDAFVAELLQTLPPELAAHARVRFCGPNGTDALHSAVTLVQAATGGKGVLTLTDGNASLPDAPEPTAPRPAGVIVEPVRCDDGVTPAPDAWLRRMRDLTAARSLPLIADETETGVGRTGAFWAVEHSGIAPDVMILSKAIGGSLPLAVVIHRADLDLRQPEASVGMFRGNQLAMAAGAATLSYVRENRLAERAATLGSRMLDQLRALEGEFPWAAATRGRGLMIGVEFANGTCTDRQLTAAQDPLRPTAPDLAAVQRECLNRGLIVELTGRHSHVVRLLPPLTITDDQATAVLIRLTDAIEAVDHAHSTRLRGRTQRAG
ncbi:aminotransferase class III-fold pyridoxal phosphate-dependent enzyme [Streptomyces sp. 7R007]